MMEGDAGQAGSAQARPLAKIPAINAAVQANNLRNDEPISSPACLVRPVTACIIFSLKKFVGKFFRLLFSPYSIQLEQKPAMTG
jgi:hypothetical protein